MWRLAALLAYVIVFFVLPPAVILNSNLFEESDRTERTDDADRKREGETI